MAREVQDFFPETQGVGLSSEEIQGCVQESLNTNLDPAWCCNGGLPALLVRMKAGVKIGHSISSQEIQNTPLSLTFLKSNLEDDAKR